VDIHPSAVIHPRARVAYGVRIGPYCVIEADVELAAGCKLESHVVIKQGTTLGPGNHIFDGAVLGGLPQHARMPPAVGRLEIGAANTIREHATIHRALEVGHVTRVGDHNLLMAGVHIAHDCRVGNHTIFANNALLAGHVEVQDRAYLSGAVAVHQFCRIGRHAMVGGLARVVKDVPPYVTIDGNSGYVVGLNTIGLRRHGFTAEQIEELKAAYRVLYRSGLAWTEILSELRRRFPAGPAACLAEFCQATRRGIVPERRLPPGATIKLHDEMESQSQLHRKAG
jgi:UDP-N-acetylglucosamine acyltransferase